MKTRDAIFSNWKKNRFSLKDLIFWFKIHIGISPFFALGKNENLILGERSELALTVEALEPAIVRSS